jgi:hypothetical protein
MFVIIWKFNSHSIFESFKFLFFDQEDWKHKLEQQIKIKWLIEQCEINFNFVNNSKRYYYEFDKLGASFKAEWIV